MKTVAAAFDSLAPTYDAVWTYSAVGHHQRTAVWRWVDPLFRPGDTILDLGCGTGEDAVHFGSRGVAVHAVDTSPEMVRLARAKGVTAHRATLPDMDGLKTRLDGAISNFGVLNCVDDLPALGRRLSRLIRPGGWVVCCLMGPCCAREILYYLLRGEPHKAFRRFTSGKVSTSIGAVVRYPRLAQILNAFRPDFSLMRWCGIGLFVPPSYVKPPTPRALRLFAGLDGRIAHGPLLRALCDHRLFLFRRL